MVCFIEWRGRMRRKVIAGNWKMNMTPSQAVKLVTELKPNVNNPDVDVVFCVPSKIGRAHV